MSNHEEDAGAEVTARCLLCRAPLDPTSTRLTCGQSLTCPARDRFVESRTAHVYFGSNGAATRKYLRELELRRPYGVLAAALFRAQKASSRAKVYRTPRHAPVSYRDAAYRRKEEALASLCAALEDSDLTWGWGNDPTTAIAPFVLYVELPRIGQVSFHAPARGNGPDFPGEWDGVRRVSEQRVIAFCEACRGSDAEETQA